MKTFSNSSRRKKPAFPCCIRWRRVKKSHVSFGPTCTCVKYIFVVDFKQCVQVVYINKIMDKKPRDSNFVALFYVIAWTETCEGSKNQIWGKTVSGLVGAGISQLALLDWRLGRRSAAAAADAAEKCLVITGQRVAEVRLRQIPSPQSGPAHAPQRILLSQLLPSSTNVPTAIGLRSDRINNLGKSSRVDTAGSTRILLSSYRPQSLLLLLHQPFTSFQHCYPAPPNLICFPSLTWSTFHCASKAPER